MLRSILGLSLALGLTLPLTAGEMDNDASAKKTQPTVAQSATTASATSAVSELDKESPTQSWRRCGYGGWGWGGGYRSYVSVGYPNYGYGYGWGGYYRPYYPAYYPYYGGVSVGFGYARPWGGIRIGVGF